MIIEQQMNRNEWLEWRKTGIGSSDASSIMGMSPYKSAAKLLFEKSGIEEEDTQMNFAMERGIRLEPFARAAFELQYGNDFPPVNMQSDKYPHMIASLDGWLDKDKIAWECKIPSREVFELAASGEIHPKYYAQVAHQRIVSEAQTVIFFVYWIQNRDEPQNGSSAQILYKRDIKFENKLIKAELEFWDYIQKLKVLGRQS